MLQTFVWVLPFKLGHPLGHVEDLILGMALPPQFLHGLLQQMGLLNLQLLDRILVLLQILIQYSPHPFVKIIHTTVGICWENIRFYHVRGSTQTWNEVRCYDMTAVKESDTICKIVTHCSSCYIIN